MLTDIFAKRYPDTVFFPQYTKAEQRLLVQSIQLIRELVPCPKNASEGINAYWKQIDARIARELGLPILALSYENGYSRTPAEVCERWAYSTAGIENPNEFMKDRLSLVELALRLKGEMVTAANASLESRCAEYLMTQRAMNGAPFVARIPGDPTAWIKVKNAEMNKQFNDAVEELNVRFNEAGVKLHYHNGFIQRSDDVFLSQDLEAPFWHLVREKKWENVDHDMKEAIDLYDNDGRDPAWYAARALESTIKIISNTNGWTRGTEKGAANYVDNLVSKGNGRFLEVWEGDVLRDFFTKVRNPFGHGPGEEPMPSLTPEQTMWAIRTCMSWVTSLVTRMKT